MYDFMEKAICEEMLPGLPQLWCEVGAVAGVVERAMSKDPNNRFQDAAEFAATLKTLDINPAITRTKETGFTLQASRS